MERGEIEVTPLLETSLDLDPPLLDAIGATADAAVSDASLAVSAVLFLVGSFGPDPDCC